MAQRRMEKSMLELTPRDHNIIIELRRRSKSNTEDCKLKLELDGQCDNPGQQIEQANYIVGT